MKKSIFIAFLVAAAFTIAAGCKNNDTMGVLDAGGRADASHNTDASTMPGNDAGGGTPVDAGTTTMDAGEPVDANVMADAGLDCFGGTPVHMVDFLNHCTTAETTTKTPVIPLGNPDAGM